MAEFPVITTKHMVDPATGVRYRSADDGWQEVVTPQLSAAPPPSFTELARRAVQKPARALGMSDHAARDFSERLIGRPTPRRDADGLTRFMEGLGLVSMSPLSPVLPAGEAVLQSSRGNRGAAVANAALAAAEAALIGKGLKHSYQSARQAMPEIGEAAAQTYKIGQRLERAGNYSGAGGKPSAVALPDQGRFAAKPISPIEDAAISYMNKRGMDTTGFYEYPPFSEERARFIAAAYDMMKHAPDDPAVKKAYDAMIQETMDQYRALKDSGIEFKFMKEGMDDPYAASPALGYQDVVERGNLWVFPTEKGYGSGSGFDASSNPLLVRVGRVGDKEDAVANDAFRAVHDVFGHFGSGNPFFRHKGEERAFLEHSRMYSPEARGAMAAETRGQNSWLNFGPYGEANRKASSIDTVYGDQKAGLMPSWTFKPEGMPSEQEAIDLLNYMRQIGMR